MAFVGLFGAAAMAAGGAFVDPGGLAPSAVPLAANEAFLQATPTASGFGAIPGGGVSAVGAVGLGSGFALRAGVLGETGYIASITPGASIRGNFVERPGLRAGFAAGFAGSWVSEPLGDGLERRGIGMGVLFAIEGGSPGVRAWLTLPIVGFGETTYAIYPEGPFLTTSMLAFLDVGLAWCPGERTAISLGKRQDEVVAVWRRHLSADTWLGVGAGFFSGGPASGLGGLVELGHRLGGAP